MYPSLPITALHTFFFTRQIKQQVQRLAYSVHLLCGMPHTCKNVDVASGPQTLFFKAETGNALSIFLAGFAFTTTVLPKISHSGLTRVLSFHRPGMVNTPVFFTSCIAISARPLIIFPLNSNKEPTHSQYSQPFMSQPFTPALLVIPQNFSSTTEL